MVADGGALPRRQRHGEICRGRGLLQKLEDDSRSVRSACISPTKATDSSFWWRYLLRRVNFPCNGKFCLQLRPICCRMTRQGRNGRRPQKILRSGCLSIRAGGLRKVCLRPGKGSWSLGSVPWFPLFWVAKNRHLLWPCFLLCIPVSGNLRDTARRHLGKSECSGLRNRSREGLPSLEQCLPRFFLGAPLPSEGQAWSGPVQGITWDQRTGLGCRWVQIRLRAGSGRRTLPHRPVDPTALTSGENPECSIGGTMGNAGGAPAGRELHLPVMTGCILQLTLSRRRPCGRETGVDGAGELGQSRLTFCPGIRRL